MHITENPRVSFLIFTTLDKIRRFTRFSIKKTGLSNVSVCVLFFSETDNQGFDLILVGLWSEIR